MSCFITGLMPHSLQRMYYTYWVSAAVVPIHSMCGLFSFFLNFFWRLLKPENMLSADRKYDEFSYQTILSTHKLTFFIDL